ncbi:dTDP-4-dehydrorhamnose 3,5-epimerase [Microbacter margulisiae]|uniref:dTDP-4-dehydrorhamnose 3,5-epimerase n=1 Tax=Microbacter margulisiae TaxID=1350067 RepID=A0A7W5DRG3_9PORP|nr:dTDP-4-dehydrorhamnose 3,5-epimerase [Microbacter margulisiae]MBB3187732.1 dTDP-4-dehydrorhamnose 3,5-epimerase [Microbacter margulisiae]
MEIIKTQIPDLLIVKNRFFKDERGFFMEHYNKKQLAEHNIHIAFCQDNLSQSSYGVIRGLHYQLAPHAQTKLVSVIVGRVWDVAVDLRKGSPTFGQWVGIELSDDNKTHFLIPQGFAHGFSVLSETAIFSYKCDQYYNQPAERGIRFDDPALAIDWRIPTDQAIVSPKDKIHPDFAEAEMNFNFISH